MIADNLTHFPSLKSDTVDAVKRAAVERTRAALGARPTLETYLEQAGPEPQTTDYIPVQTFRERWLEHVTITDFAIPVILLALLGFSLSHMMEFAGRLAYRTRQAAPWGVQTVGVWFSDFLSVLLTQGSLLFLSEFGVLFFITRHLTRLKEKTGGRWYQKISLNLVFAIGCSILVWYANVAALLHGAVEPQDYLIAVFIGTLVTLINIVLGERITEILNSRWQQDHELKVSYGEAVDSFKDARAERTAAFGSADRRWHELHEAPAKFDLDDGENSYQRYLAAAIVDYYKRTKKGMTFTSWTPAFEELLAAREMAKMQSMRHLGDAINYFLAQDQHSASALPNSPVTS